MIGLNLKLYHYGLFTGWFLIFQATVVFAQNNTAEDEKDWPSMITRLRREMHMHSGSRYKQQLAIAYNNYGVQLADQEEWSLARRQFDEAMRLDDSNENFPKNLANIYMKEAHVYYEQRKKRDAKPLLAKAIKLNPELTQAYIMLGDIEYDAQQLKSAKELWQKATELEPNNENLQERFNRVSEELPIESEFNRIFQAYFDLRYEEEQIDRPVGFDIRDALRKARREVGLDFAYWPNYKIVVLLYGEQSFRMLHSEVPEWVGAQYDGKIRVPLPSGKFDKDHVQEIVSHEYTHALVHDLSRGNCPVWFNEGLAGYQGSRAVAPTLTQLKKAYDSDQMISWDELSDHFSHRLTSQEVALAYQQSFSIIQYIETRYGFWRIRRILKKLAEKDQPIEKILKDEFSISLERLQRNWHEWLGKYLQEIAAN